MDSIFSIALCLCLSRSPIFCQSKFVCAFIGLFARSFLCSSSFPLIIYLFNLFFLLLLSSSTTCSCFVCSFINLSIHSIHHLDVLILAKFIFFPCFFVWFFIPPPRCPRCKTFIVNFEMLFLGPFAGACEKMEGKKRKRKLFVNGNPSKWHA